MSHRLNLSHWVRRLLEKAVASPSRRSSTWIGRIPEALESRWVLDGNVSAVLIGNDLHLNGGSANEGVEITSSGTNLVVRGLNSTTINGGNSDFVVRTGSTQLKGNLYANLHAGNDTLLVTGGVKLRQFNYIQLGAGNDTFGLNGASVRKYLDLNTGDGDDAVSLQSAVISTSALFGLGNGDDTFSMLDSVVGRYMTLDAGAGDDAVVIDGDVDGRTIGRASTILTGFGNDSLVVRDATFNREFYFDASVGSDYVNIDPTTFRRDATFFLGEGDDNFELDGANTFQRGANIVGQGGMDAVEIDSTNTFNRGRTVTTTESTNVPDTVTEDRLNNPTTGALTRATQARQTVTNQSSNAVLTLTVNPSTVAENAGANALTGTVSRTGSTTNALTVTLTSGDVTELTVPATVTIAAGQTNATFQISAVDDTTTDGTQAVTLTAAATGFSNVTQAVSVTDNETATLTISLQPESVTESAGADSVTGTVTRNTATTDALTVTLGSNLAATVSAPATVTIPAGQTSTTFTLDITNDTAVNGTRTATITASSTGFVSGTDDLSVTDDDVGTLGLTATTTSIQEGETPTTIVTVTRTTGDTSGALTVSLGSSNTLLATVPSTVTIAAGQTSTTFTVTSVEDTIFDSTQDVTITGTASGFSNGQLAISRSDNDGPAALSLSLNPTSAGDTAGSNASTATLTRNTRSTSALLVALTSSHPNSASVPATVEIPAGQSSTTFAITTLDDVNVFGSLNVTIGASASGLNAASSVIVVTDVLQPQLGLSFASPFVRETPGVGSITSGTVTRPSVVSSGDLAVTITVSDSANLTAETTVTIPAGETSATFDIEAVNDVLADGTVAVTVTVSAAQFRSASQSVNVEDDDGPAAVSLTTSTANVNEDGGLLAATGTVTRNTPATSELVVSLSASVAGLVLIPQTVTIAAGQQFQTFVIEALDNAIVGGDQNVVLTASATNHSSGTRTITVIDDEVPELTVSFATSTASEAGATVIGTVTRPNVGNLPSVQVTLGSNQTSRVTVPTSVVIPSGETSVNFNATTIENTTADDDINVTVTASASGFRDGTSVLSVEDNDGVPTLTLEIDSNSIEETDGAAAARATITRNTDTTGSLVVTIAQLDGSSSPSLVLPSTVTIPAGSASVQFEIGVTNNTAFSGTTTFVLTASASGFATGNSLPVTIVDDDFPTLTVTIDATSVSEAAGTGAVTGTVTRPLAARFRSNTITLASNSPDRLFAPATVSFADEATSATFTLTPVNNTEADGDATVTITASNADYNNGTDSLTVIDDDFLFELSTAGNTLETVNDTLITKSDAFLISGSTEPDAQVQVDTDGDGFDDASTTASDVGGFSLLVPLSHSTTNNGLNNLRVKSATMSNPEGLTRSLIVHYAVGTVVKFSSNVGDFAVELLDAEAPNTSTNFKNYLARYTDSIIHRSLEGLVIQGGGFTVDPVGTVTDVSPDLPVSNEFNANNSNLRGTLSIALPDVINGENLGTNQWFINVANNAELDAELNTVFGRVIGDGILVVDAINDLSIVNLEVQTNLTALGSVPLRQSPNFEELSGLISVSTGSTNVTGIGTQFTTDLVDRLGTIPGSIIRIGSSTYQVLTIESDTSLTLTTPVTETLSNSTAERFAAPLSDQYVVFSSIAEILNGGT